jgi:hypothetical protein
VVVVVVLVLGLSLAGSCALDRGFLARFRGPTVEGCHERAFPRSIEHDDDFSCPTGTSKVRRARAKPQFGNVIEAYCEDPRGAREGRYEVRLLDGFLYEIGQYKDGKKDGCWEHIDGEGFETDIIVYQAGSLINHVILTDN